MLRAEFATAPDRLRDAGMAQAEQHADPRVIATIDATIERAVASRMPFSVVDIRVALPTVTSPGLIGARFRAAAMRKPTRMRQTGRFVKSDLPSTRSARVAEWIGVAT